MVVVNVDKLTAGARTARSRRLRKPERKDLADKEASEMVVLQAYLPARLSAEEVTPSKPRVVELGAMVRAT
jgi:uncharacterized protein YqeY